MAAKIKNCPNSRFKFLSGKHRWFSFGLFSSDSIIIAGNEAWISFNHLRERVIWRESQFLKIGTRRWQ